MCGRGPTGDDLVCIEIDDRDFCIRPQADERTFAVGFDEHGVRERVLLHGRFAHLVGDGRIDLAATIGRAWRVALRLLGLRVRGRQADRRFVLGVLQRDANQRIGPHSRDEQIFSRFVQGQPARNHPLIANVDADRAVIVQQPLVEIPDVNAIELAATGIELLAVRREREARERLRHRHPRCDFAARRVEVEDRDFVFLHAVVQHRREQAVRVEFDVNRQVADFELLPNGIQFPLIRQLDEAALLDSGQHALHWLDSLFRGLGQRGHAKRHQQCGREDPNHVTDSGRQGLRSHYAKRTDLRTMKKR